MSKFYNCKLFSLYIGKGIRWFSVFKLKITLKHINKYKFKSDNPKGFYVGYWLVNLS